MTLRLKIEQKLKFIFKLYGWQRPFPVLPLMFWLALPCIIAKLLHIQLKLHAGNWDRLEISPNDI